MSLNPGKALLIMSRNPGRIVLILILLCQMASLTEAIWGSSRRQVENSDRLTEELHCLLPQTPTEVTLASEGLEILTTTLRALKLINLITQGKI